MRKTASCFNHHEFHIYYSLRLTQSLEGEKNRNSDNFETDSKAPDASNSKPRRQIKIPTNNLLKNDLIDRNSAAFLGHVIKVPSPVSLAPFPPEFLSLRRGRGGAQQTIKPTTARQSDGQTTFLTTFQTTIRGFPKQREGPPLGMVDAILRLRPVAECHLMHGMVGCQGPDLPSGIKGRRDPHFLMDFGGEALKFQGPSQVTRKCNTTR
ncbi:hypothetical protein CEXT_117441 [Caerostris extrusa]|uniref:Uncharacterized protein n=1 Tax=Caerostris extrusa TaxID=172846 RepID=A0AAV4RZR5_CAEEX|nr:hypothetical protein CEXT_117441 [Caerostris extrusa]